MHCCDDEPEGEQIDPESCPHHVHNFILPRSKHDGVRWRSIKAQLAVDAATQTPTLFNPDVTASVDQIHSALTDPADIFAAESGALALRDLVQPHLKSTVSTASDKPLARRPRQLLDDRLPNSVTIAEAAADLSAHRSHLVRVFTETYGIAPHQYVAGRRVDRPRRLLLCGRSPAEAAAESGFHDQSHLARHFRKTLGTTPGVFAA